MACKSGAGGCNASLPGIGIAMGVASGSKRTRKP